MKNEHLKELNQPPSKGKKANSPTRKIRNMKHTSLSVSGSEVVRNRGDNMDGWSILSIILER